MEDPAIWKGKASNLLTSYEAKLYQFFKRGLMDKEEKVWTFWNAVFYCGTIYTTIGKSIFFFFAVYCLYYIVISFLFCHFDSTKKGKSAEVKLFFPIASIANYIS